MRSAVSCVVALCAGALLSACASGGLYQAREGESGYAETRLSDTRWHVEFVGDAFSSRDLVETYLLYRAAELTIERGYDWFVLSAPAADLDGEIVVSGARPDAARANWRPQWRRRGRFGWTDWDPAGPRTPDALTPAEQRARYAASADIAMGRGAAPEGAIAAHDTLRALGPSVTRPPS